MTKSRPVCPICQGTNILLDAHVEWYKGTYDIANIFDSGYCRDCDDHFKYCDTVTIQEE